MLGEMLCNTSGGGVKGQRDQGRFGLEAESRPCCREVTKWDVPLWSHPFSQSRPIIQHVTKYLVNSICLNFQDTQQRGNRERPVNKRLQQLNHGMYITRLTERPWRSQFQCLISAFYIFYAQFCCIVLQTGSISRGLVELCFYVKAISCAECLQMNLLHYVEHVCIRCYVLESSETLWTTMKWKKPFFLGLRRSHS